MSLRQFTPAWIDGLPSEATCADKQVMVYFEHPSIQASTAAAVLKSPCQGSEIRVQIQAASMQTLAKQRAYTTLPAYRQCPGGHHSAMATLYGAPKHAGRGYLTIRRSGPGTRLRHLEETLGRPGVHPIQSKIYTPTAHSKTAKSRAPDTLRKTMCISERPEAHSSLPGYS